MSLYDYRKAQELVATDVPFYALIMAAMLRAGGENVGLLREAYPDVHAELDRRYNAGGGLLPGDVGYEDVQRTRREIGLPTTD